jgi:antitoxin component of MazEF toxin-antitoxin module
LAFTIFKGEKAGNSLNFGFFCQISYLVKLLDMKTMGYPTKIQIIKRANSEQWYVNFPAAVAQAIEFQQGEIVEWLIDDHQNLVLKRSDEAVAPLKKKLKTKKKG